jgi:hypothetical protein
VVGPPVTVADTVPLAALVIANHDPPRFTASLKVTEMGASEETADAPLAGLVLTTAGGAGGGVTVAAVTFKSSIRQFAVPAAALPAPL